jgi:hypothetical protein
MSPDELWIAVTRAYSAPARGHIWDDSGAHTCLLVREVDDPDGTGANLALGSDFFYWEAPASVQFTKVAWSSDSRFLVLLCSSAEGHQPWAFSVLVLDMKDDTVRSTDPLGIIVSQDLKFNDSGALELKTGEPSSPQPVSFDLEKHIAELPVVAKLPRESLLR